MQKWEYQVVGPIKDIFEGKYPMRVILSSEGQDYMKIGSAISDISAGTIKAEAQQLAAYVALQGLDGWELAGVGTTSAGHLLYFKRPVTEKE